jgi:hypothetical protein
MGGSGPWDRPRLPPLLRSDLQLLRLRLPITTVLGPRTRISSKMASFLVHAQQHYLPLGSWSKLYHQSLTTTSTKSPGRGVLLRLWLHRPVFNRHTARSPPGCKHLRHLWDPLSVTLCSLRHGHHRLACLYFQDFCVIRSSSKDLSVMSTLRYLTYMFVVEKHILVSGDVSNGLLVSAGPFVRVIDSGDHTLDLVGKSTGQENVRACKLTPLCPLLCGVDSVAHSPSALPALVSPLTTPCCCPPYASLRRLLCAAPSKALLRRPELLQHLRGSLSPCPSAKQGRAQIL